MISPQYTDGMRGVFPWLFPSRQRHFLAVDIGSDAAIRSFLFAATPTERTAIAKHTFELPPRERARDLIPLIRGELMRTLEHTVRRHIQMPEQTLIGLGGHFTFNETLTLRKERAQPSEAIGTGEVSAMLSSLRDEAGKIVGGRTYCLVSVSPLRVRVDGYTVQTLTRQTRGRTIELTVFATYALQSYWMAISELRERWSGLAIRTIADQAAIAAALIAARPIREALIVKIGARITEVSLVGGGDIRFTGRFALGGEAVTRSLREHMGIAIREAEHIKRQWEHTVLPPHAKEIARRAISEAVTDWLKGLTHLIQTTRYPVPAQIFLLGGGSRLTAVREALVHPAWHKGLSAAERVEVARLDAEELMRPLFRNESPALSGPEEVALAAIAYRLVQEAEPSRER